MQDYVTPLPLVALLSTHAACIAASIAIVLAASPAPVGWRLVGPGGTHWFCFIGSWAFGALISWMWLFVGSGRADAEFQMGIAFLLATLFCVAGAWSGYRIAALRRMALRWRGGSICWRERGQVREQEFARFHSIRRSFDGNFQVRFSDQSVLALDLHARNSSEFLTRISEEIGSDVY